MRKIFFILGMGIMVLNFGCAPVLVSQAQTKHTIGEKFGGGIVFAVTKHGLHGLIAETIDQSNDCKWKDAPSVITDPINHSTDGKAFTDWRLPTNVELDKLSEKQDIVGGFADGLYWATVSNNGGSYVRCFVTTTINGTGIVAHRVRAVRAF
jgi:hypothetical protein